MKRIDEVLMHTIQTERLILRPWQAQDLEPFTQINQNSRVMEFIPKKLSRAEVQALMESFNASIERDGFGLFACEHKQNGDLMGFVGLNRPSFKSHFTPCVEVGWRLGYAYWGKGYATEAAKRMLALGFNDYQLPEIVSFTTTQNIRSIRVMERLGMQHNPADDFYHPRLPKDHPLVLHVLYRLSREEYNKQFE